ncbi:MULTISPECIES: HNH endonuclease [Pseudanabaena]|uniref:HNH endonuclease n=2 Tax=Pseudanabaena TaxID=1152 RepID=L8MU45_9CYAN|nr:MULTISPECIES: HNH endonuclease signature motif containing protein [Pseudanabaena]ELS30976.1 HNH endonuclease [Pseudanabaena biceps PCC 7429]MDG3496754.1 HNH endonuclease signature motif containing protein [Pseudanabaena catenata USMAC16]
MTSYISNQLRQLVTVRADGKCEYCLIHQDFSIYRHEVDHATSVKYGGLSTEENLVLACLPCNRYKGSDLTSIDPITKQITVLFNPRLHEWNEHFQIDQGYILGKTTIGRTTIFLLKLNEPKRLMIRQALILQKLYP